MKLQAAGKASKWYVYQKIVIVFILFLLPLISMNIWLNYKGMSVTKNAILNSSQAGASFYSKQLDKEMYFIRNLQLQLINDKDLQKLSFRGSLLGDYEEVQLIEQVRDLAVHAHGVQRIRGEQRGVRGIHPKDHLNELGGYGHAQ